MLNSNNLDQQPIIESKNSSVENAVIDEPVKKKRGRQPKNAVPKELLSNITSDSQIVEPTKAKRSRKKTKETSIEESINVNNSINNKIEPNLISNSALSQLTQFASSTDLNKLSSMNKMLPNIPSQLDVKQFLNNAELANRAFNPSLSNQAQLFAQQELIARHALINNNAEKKSQLSETTSTPTKKKSSKSAKSSSSTNPVSETVSLTSGSLPTTAVSTSVTNTSTIITNLTQASKTQQTSNPPPHHMPSQSPYGLPPNTQPLTQSSMHNNLNAASLAASHSSRQNLPNHHVSLINAAQQHQQPPNYALPPHHSPYYPHAHYPPTSHPQASPYLPPPYSTSHPMGNQQAPPNFASQFANQFRFPPTGYPQFYDPAAYAQYFGHHSAYPPMGYYPPNHQPPVQSNPHPIPPTSHIPPGHPSATSLQAANQILPTNSTPSKTTAQSTSSSSSSSSSSSKKSS